MDQATRIRLHSTFWRHQSCIPFSEDAVPSSLFLKHRHFLVIDVETKQLAQDVGGWDHVDKLGISIACAYDSKSDTMISFREHELKNLIALCEERLVIGYNVKGFDLPVLAPYGIQPKSLDVFDIMLDLESLTRQRYLKLEAVARGTLGTGKSADGIMAVTWWREGNVQKIIDYCIQDVQVTLDIFRFGRQNGYVRIQRGEDGDKAKQVSVQWN